MDIRKRIERSQRKEATVDIKKRVERLEQAHHAATTTTVFFWRSEGGLTPEQQADIKAAEARGDKVLIFGWADSDEEPPDLNELIRNASDDELREIIANGVRR